MPNFLMYQQDNFVVLEPNQPEQFLTTLELLAKLQQVLSEIPDSDLSPDLQKLTSLAAKAQYLLDTGCKLDIASGKYLQWYAVRLEK
jgi:hypothetical protein